MSNDKYKKVSVTLTGKEIRELAELVGLQIVEHNYADEYETEITVETPSFLLTDDWVEEHYRLIAYLTEYPEEGAIGLGDAISAAQEPQINLEGYREAGKQDQAAELEAARAEIERLENQVQARDAELWGRTQKILQLEQQLAAEQAKNVGLRELVEHFALIDLGRSLLPGDFGLWVLRARKAIATPSDTSSLEAIVKKAGEVMRERCASESCRSHEYDATKAIRTIPAVTLEDLK